MITVPVQTSLRSAAAAAAGPDAVMEPHPDVDEIDGVLPAVVVRPSSAEGVAATLAWVARDTLRTVISGGGTKRAWGRRPERVDVLLRMDALNRVMQLAADDLTVTVEAGATLASVNAALSAHGQWLPLDPPFSDRTTIGGLLATNDSGPHRHRHGTPRDLVIRSRIATADGRLSKSGGQVVKNVAGYDVSKLLCGSFGTLAAYVSATFKVVPRADTSRTVVVTCATGAIAGQFLRELMASQLEPAAVELAVRASHGPRHPEIRLLVRFASITAAVDAQIDAVLALAAASAATSELTTTDAEPTMWADHHESIWTGGQSVVRLSWLPADLTNALDVIARLGESCELVWIGRAALGAGLLSINGHPSVQEAIVKRLRSTPAFAHVAIARAPAEVKAHIDVWGPLGDRTALLAALKQQFDPAAILNAGRGPI